MVLERRDGVLLSLRAIREQDGLGQHAPAISTGGALLSVYTKPSFSLSLRATAEAASNSQGGFPSILNREVSCLRSGDAGSGIRKPWRNQASHFSSAFCIPWFLVKCPDLSRNSLSAKRDDVISLHQSPVVLSSPTF